jgi:putative hydrolase of the HAD superfamily
MVPDFRGVQVVIFDLDDTLCGYWDAAKAGLSHTFDVHKVEGKTKDEVLSAWAEAFRSFCSGIKKTDWYETYLKCGEPTRTETMRLMLEILGVKDDALASAMSETYFKARDAHLKLFPEALETLESLKGYSLGLLTNGPADIQRQEVATLGIERFFKWIYIEGELGFGKPDVRTLEIIEEASGCSGSEILFVGNDYGHDIRPAIERGWRTLWVRRPSDIAPSETKPKEMPEGAPLPDGVVDSLVDLPRMLGT